MKTRTPPARRPIFLAENYLISLDMLEEHARLTAAGYTLKRLMGVRRLSSGKPTLTLTWSKPWSDGRKGMMTITHVFRVDLKRIVR